MEQSPALGSWTLDLPVYETPMEGWLPGKTGNLCRFVGKCRFSFVEVGFLDSRPTASWGTPWVAPGWDGGSEKKM